MCLLAANAYAHITDASNVCTATFCAASNGHARVCAALLAAGGDANQPWVQDQDR